MEKQSSYVYIRKTKKGEILYLCLINGKRLSTKLINTQHNYNVALRILDKLNNELMNEEKMQNEYFYTVQSLIQEFIEHQKLKGNSKSTIYYYKNIFKFIFKDENFIIDQKVQYKNKEIYLIEKKLLDWLVNEKSKFKTSTINLYLAKFNLFVNYLANNDYIEKRLYLTEKYCQQYTPEPPKHYTKEELNNIIHKAIFKDKEFALLLLFLYYTGARIMEAINLTWDRIDLESKSIFVRNKIKKNEIEEIPISIKTERILLLLKQLAIKNPKHKSNKVFRWNNRESALHYLKIILDELGINENYKSFHRFRKNYAQMLLDQQLTMGISDDVIKLLIRHRNIDLTRSAYGKTKTKLLADTMNRMYV